MKKRATLLIATLIFIGSFKGTAAIVIVNVQDFEFDPSSFTINLGDQVMWTWDNSAGQHTTTSTTIPPGAATWDQVISQSSQMFTYTPTVAGSYDYICIYHQAMGMVGHFTVNPVGIISIIPAPILAINGSLSSSINITINYGVPHTQKISLSLYDILGKSVGTLFSENRQAGVYMDTYPIDGLRNGVYFLQLKSSEAIVTRKIIIN
ncbi:MAG: T9SS type A sorting domain-containing protein [Bacteroidota bacterium]